MCFCGRLKQYLASEEKGLNIPTKRAKQKINKGMEEEKEDKRGREEKR